MTELNELEIIINSRIRKIIRNSQEIPKGHYNPYRDNYSAFKRVLSVIEKNPSLQKKYDAFLNDCDIDNKERTVSYGGKLQEKDFPKE